MVALLLLTLLAGRSAAGEAADHHRAATRGAGDPGAAAAPVGSATTTALLFITDGTGRPIEDVTVNVMGPVDREVKSPASGPTRVEGLRAGTYRVRFTHEKFITFEKEIVLARRHGAPELSITLNAAPAAAAPPPPPPAPVGQARAADAEAAAAGHAEDHVAARLHREELHQRARAAEGKPDRLQRRRPGAAVADPRAVERPPARLRRRHALRGRRRGPLKLGEREFTVAAGAFAVVPRGTTYSLSRSGRNPLIVLAVLAGAPCAAE